MRFSAVTVLSEGRGIATVHVCRHAESDSIGVVMGELEMDLEEAAAFVECLRLGSGLARIFEEQGI